MRIEKLHIQNFRGFKDLTIEFPSDLAVLIGVNGSGKSSILDCIAVFLSTLVTGIRSFHSLRGSELPSFTETDITNGCEESHAQISIVFNSEPLDLSIVLTKESSRNDPDKVKLTIGEYVFPNKYDLRSNLKDAEKFHNLIYDRFRNDAYASLPLLVYYPSQRTIYEIPLESDEKHEFNQLSAYDRTITKKVDFTDFFIWYRNQEDLENETRLDSDPSYADRNLKAIRVALLALIPEFSYLRVRRSPLRMTVTKVVDREAQELIINQLSDGEKSLLAMVGDLARRLAIANPNLENPLDGSGIVLIDEIELHLHPQWQRRIIPALTKIFPNLQFIITTHSPQVLSNVQRENVFILEDFKLVEKTPYTYGRDSNSILFELMGVEERIPEIKQELDACFDLIDRDEIEKAKEKLQELSNKLGQNDPEIVRANTLIDFFHRIE